MSVQMVLLPVFVQVGLTFALLIAMSVARIRSLKSGEARIKDIALREPNWSPRVTQLNNCFSNQLEVPVLFYVLVALAMPLRHADLFIVLMSWLFVVTRFVHAGIFITSNNVQQRGPAWFAGVIVLLVMWVYFALRILFAI
ncbi:MAG: MAPEG family protein [Rhizobiales bacterium]|nr:MAPEG family protein [Hyphomicrobiales bacterium]